MTPTQLVLRWLDEAQSYDDFSTYARSLIDAGPDAFPMDRLAREAEECARSQVRGKPREEADAAIRRAVVETVFRVQLVLRINVASQEFLDREGLIQAALSAQLGLIVDRRPEAGVSDTLRQLVEFRDLLLGRVTELHAFEAARARVVGRYLDAAAADFPAARRTWTEQRSRSETMAVMAMRIAELDGAPGAPPDDQAVFDARVSELVSDLVEPARSTAYDELGDGRRALTVAVRWLRPKLLGDQATSS